MLLGSHAARNTDPSQGTLRRAAAYVRASTDRQEFSIENQLQAIKSFAAAHDFVLVRVYSDETRSGLSLKGRKALQQLLADVKSGTPDFETVLIYDVSRWGRFQNVDESAHYEYACRRAGVAIEYCSDGFANDGSLLATIIKGVKRSMAAEFSRELSAKISRGKLQLARHGFHQGGRPGFGLRRVLIDQSGTPRISLSEGDQKYFQNDRVILVPGPEEDVAVVRKMFQLFVEEHRSLDAIAKTLNEQGFRTSSRKCWRGTTVKIILQSERYAGHLYYNRGSQKLGSKREPNSQSEWVRALDVIDPIIDASTFAAAQKRLAKKKLDSVRSFSDADLLNHLTAVWCVAGRLSSGAMWSVPHTPSSGTYGIHFGSLRKAFDLVGYRQTRPYQYAQHSALLHRITRDLICKLTEAVQRRGGAIRLDPGGDILHIDERVSVTVAVLPYLSPPLRSPGWWFHVRFFDPGDLLFLVRLNEQNESVLDRYLMPFPPAPGRNFNFNDDCLAILSAQRMNRDGQFYSQCRALGTHSK